MWALYVSVSLCEIDNLVQDCSNSIANAVELLQSCTKPSQCNPRCPIERAAPALNRLRNGSITC